MVYAVVMNQKGYLGVIVTVGVLLLFLIGGASFYFGRISVKPKTSATVLVTNQSQPSSPAVYTQQNISSPIPTPNPTQDWVSYWDPNSTLSLKYPPYWTKTISGDTVTLKKIYDPNSAPEPLTEGVDITIYKNKGSLAAREFLSQIYYGSYPNNSLTQAWINDDTIEPIMIGNNIKAEKIDSLAQGFGSDGSGVWFGFLGQGFFIKFYSYKTDTWEKIYQPLLSSIQFVTP